MAQRNERALVTLAVGDDYVSDFLRIARPSWEAYCRRHGLDLILFTEPIDPAADFSRKSIHWQKLLIGTLPQLRGYKALAWMDGDILINHRLAPSVFDGLGDGIGVVDASDWFHRADDLFNLHTRYLILNYFMKRKLGGALPAGRTRPVVTDGSLPDYYRLLGFPGKTPRMINTGLFVFDPAKHGDFLAGVYAKYDRDSVDFENTPLSFELQASGRAEYLDPRFNVLWSRVLAEHYPFLFDPDLADRARLLGLCVNAALRNAYFLHFAAGSGNPIVKGAFEGLNEAAENIVEVVFPELWARREALLEIAPLAGLDPGDRGVLL